jgi:phage virion morphogenesis protein
MTAITIQIHDQAVRAALGALQQRVQSMQPLLQALGDDITQRAKQRFNTETGPDGQRWKDNTPATKKAKGGKSILFDKGELRRQIVPQVAGNTLTVSSTPIYAAIQQFGATIHKQAGTTTVRHRTDAKGELLRSAIMNGKGLIFAKASHKRALERSFPTKAHTIIIPARPFMPVRADGSLYPQEQTELLALLNAFLAQRP